MQLKLINSFTSSVIIRDKYECPCGEGIVVYKKCEIPSFKETNISCNCKRMQQ